MLSVFQQAKQSIQIDGRAMSFSFTQPSVSYHSLLVTASSPRDRDAQNLAAFTVGAGNNAEQPSIDRVIGMIVRVSHDLDAAERSYSSAKCDVACPMLVVVHA